MLLGQIKCLLLTWLEFKTGQSNKMTPYSLRNIWPNYITTYSDSMLIYEPDVCCWIRLSVYY